MDANTKAQYEEKGYIVVKNAVPREYILNLHQVVASVLTKHCAGIPAFSKEDPWSDPAFHAAMLKFRTERPQEFGYLFDTVQTSVALWRLGTDQKLCAIAAELMNDTDSGLSVTDLLLRMDAPRDTRNKLEWHQDSSYFRQNDRGENGCVCSISMKDVALENGPLEILPGSHALGRIEVSGTDKNDINTSEQYRVPLEYVQRFSPEQVPLSAGDAILFNFDLIHRSGFNSSGLFRFTAIARYSDCPISSYADSGFQTRPTCL
jgi:ectoine hydroxylase-related dioxygenase (phytanoyl-CoA dioxygenase family)